MRRAAYGMYGFGTAIYVAPTWDRGEPWLSTVRHIAKEGRVYVVAPCCAVRVSDVPERYVFRDAYHAAANGWINSGDSVVVDPDGKVIAGPVRETESIVYADVDPARVTGTR